MEIKWREGYSVGSMEMDNEHKQLVRLINQMFKVIKKNDFERNHKQELNSVLQGLIQYTIEHFKNEEKFMEEINFLYLSEHKKIHEQLLKDISNFELFGKVVNFDEKAMILYKMLRDWLIKHILEEDMKYKEHIAS